MQILEELLKIFDALPNRETVRKIAMQMYQEGKKAERARQEAELVRDSLKGTSNNLDVIEQQFYLFWDTYDKKRNKAAAMTVWKRLKKEERKAAILAAPLYVKSTPDKKYRLDPERYLRRKSWMDEIIPTRYGNQETERMQRTGEAQRLADALAALELGE